MAQHLHEHGGVCRSNRILCLFEHYDNPGGAVDGETTSGNSTRSSCCTTSACFRARHARAQRGAVQVGSAHALRGTKKHKRSIHRGHRPQAIERKPKGGNVA